VESKPRNCGYCQFCRFTDKVVWFHFPSSSRAPLDRTLRRTLNPLYPLICFTYHSDALLLLISTIFRMGEYVCTCFPRLRYPISRTASSLRDHQVACHYSTLRCDLRTLAIIIVIKWSTSRTPLTTSNLATFISSTALLPGSDCKVTRVQSSFIYHFQTLHHIKRGNPSLLVKLHCVLVLV
jgi:hypothetical protein